MPHSLWWLLGQFVIVAGGSVVLIAAVLVIWYGIGFLVLGLTSQLFKLRGRSGTPADYDPTGIKPLPLPEKQTVRRPD